MSRRSALAIGTAAVVAIVCVAFALGVRAGDPEVAHGTARSVKRIAPPPPHAMRSHRHRAVMATAAGAPAATVVATATATATSTPRATPTPKATPTATATPTDEAVMVGDEGPAQSGDAAATATPAATP